MGEDLFFIALGGKGGTERWMTLLAQLASMLGYTCPVVLTSPRFFFEGWPHAVVPCTSIAFLCGRTSHFSISL